MNNMQRAAVLTSLGKRLAAEGSWCGETHFQKATYFLQELLRVPIRFDFIFYKHGPFCFDLRQELIELRASRLLKAVSVPPYGPKLLDTESAERLRSLFPRTLGRYEPHICFVAERLGPKGVIDNLF